MGGLFGGGGGGSQQAAQPAPSPTPLNAVQAVGRGFGPNSQAAGAMYGDPAAVLGTQAQSANPGLGSLDDYIAAATAFLSGGAGSPGAGLGTSPRQLEPPRGPGSPPGAVISESFGGSA